MEQESTDLDRFSSSSDSTISSSSSDDFIARSLDPSDKSANVVILKSNNPIVPVAPPIVPDKTLHKSDHFLDSYMREKNQGKSEIW